MISGGVEKSDGKTDIIINELLEGSPVEISKSQESNPVVRTVSYAEVVKGKILLK